ncbi:MAG: hypothetical protein Q9224_001688 [Gallowayella concinna]
MYTPSPFIFACFGYLFLVTLPLSAASRIATPDGIPFWNRMGFNPINPTIVLVPGAFHVEKIMDLLSYQLLEAGYPTETLGLVTVNQPELTIKDDAALIDKVLHKLIEEQKKEVVMYLHSYAGFPGSTAIKGFSKAERQAVGKRGGILGLIYQSAFIPQPGNTLRAMIGGSYAPWQDANTETGLINVIDAKTTFYADVNEPLADKAVKLILPQSLLSFNTPSDQTYYGHSAYDHRRIYLHTKQDQALPPFAQDAFVAGSGTTWHVEKLDTSHSPFLSEAPRLAALVVNTAKAFEATYHH